MFDPAHGPDCSFTVPRDQFLVAATVQSEVDGCRVEKCKTVRNTASLDHERSRHKTVREGRLHAGENAARHHAATRWRLRFMVAPDQQLRGSFAVQAN
jgi:hypothetical protein